jgi:hypothetical protein
VAFYLDTAKVKKTSPDAEEKYKEIWKPGEDPDYPGIYKCQKCNYEDVINRECDKLPPCSNCKTKSMTWKLLVRATDGNKK